MKTVGEEEQGVYKAWEAHATIYLSTAVGLLAGIAWETFAWIAMVAMAALFCYTITTRRIFK